MLHVWLEREDMDTSPDPPHGATQTILPPIGSPKPVLVVKFEMLKLLVTASSVKLKLDASKVSFCSNRRKTNLV